MNMNTTFTPLNVNTITITKVNTTMNTMKS